MSAEAQRLNPYVGLRPFDRADTLYFFGRREQVADLLDRLHETRFLAVVGSSGCGKSSLIQAGLIPALLGGFLVQDRDRWLVARLKPGDGPLQNLALALAAVDGHDPKPSAVDALAAAIDERHARAVIEHLKPHLGTDANLLLLIDQFEEIFAFRGRAREEPLLELGRTERQDLAWRQREAADFVDVALALAQQSEVPVYLVLAMRSDFLGDCDLFYGLPEAMNRSRYLVPRLGRGQLREAIEGPALLMGQQLSSRLVDALLNELGDRHDRLPVLQHALMRSWDVWRRDGATGPVDLAHYERAGTLRDALPSHANEALRDDDRPVVARIFRCLTDTDANRRRVRRAASFAELVAVTGAARSSVEAILQRFNADGRNFLQISAGVDPDNPQIEISHESLIRQWDQLARWVDEEREARDQFLELVKRARGGRALLQDPDLQIALGWRTSVQPTRAWAERYSHANDDLDVALDYLERSQQARLEAERRRRRARHLIVAATGVVIAALSTLTLWALDNAARARDTARVGIAGEWLDEDPTRAALLLLEVQRPERTRFAAPRMREVLKRPLAIDILRGHQGRISTVQFSPDGARIVTGSDDGTARVWGADGTGIPVVLAGHTAGVRAADFSPDGRRLVTGSDDGTARVWSADGSGEPLELSGHEGSVDAVDFSPDGSRLLTAGADGTVRVWRADDPGEPLLLRGHEAPIVAASFSPDGSRIVTGSDDGTARVWRSDGSGEPVVLRGHEGSLVSASFSPDGSRVVTSSADGTARVWNSDGSGVPIVFRTPGSYVLVETAVFSPDGSRILTTALNQYAARVWNADGSGEPVILEHERGPQRWGVPVTAVFSPDGTRVVTGLYDGTAAIWNADGSEDPVVLRGHEGPVWAVAFSPDGRHFATGSDDARARVWTVEPPAEPVVLAHDGWVESARFSPDGARVVTVADDGVARVWNADGAGEPIAFEGHGGRVTSAAFSPDGTRIVTASDDETARVWRADGSGEPVVLRGHTAAVTSAAFGPDGVRVVTSSDDQTARVWRADGVGNPLVLAGHEGWVSSAAFSADGRRVVTASVDATARVWNADGSGDPVVLRGHEGRVVSAVFSPDGRRIATASGDETARVWNADGSGEPVVLRHAGWVGSVAFSPDGTRVVTASDDETARIWSVDGSTEPVVLRGHEGQVGSASFSPDGQRVLTSSVDGTARVWSASGSGEALVLDDHADRLTAASFSPDGSHIVTASTDGTARVWVYTADRLQRAIAAATQACLSASLRESHLGESPREARRQYDRCERRHGRAR